MVAFRVLLQVEFYSRYLLVVETWRKYELSPTPDNLHSVPSDPIFIAFSSESTGPKKKVVYFESDSECRIGNIRKAFGSR